MIPTHYSLFPILGLQLYGQSHGLKAGVGKSDGVDVFVFVALVERLDLFQLLHQSVGALVTPGHCEEEDGDGGGEHQAASGEFEEGGVGWVGLGCSEVTVVEVQGGDGGDDGETME